MFQEITQLYSVLDNSQNTIFHLNLFLEKTNEIINRVMKRQKKKQEYN